MSHLKESMNTYPELMLENLKVVEYSEVKLGCAQPVLLQQLEEMESDMIDADETTVDDQEIKVVGAIEKFSNEGWKRK